MTIILFSNIPQDAAGNEQSRISENSMTVVKVLHCFENVSVLPVTQDQPHEGSKFMKIPQ